ncbi:MAG: hypothetical protein ACPIOQ_43050 [Promethearchaeia archaeon]
MLAFASLDYVDCRDDRVLWAMFLYRHLAWKRIKKQVGIRIAETDRILGSKAGSLGKESNSVTSSTSSATDKPAHQVTEDKRRGGP